MLTLECIDDYGLEGKNWYFVNAEKFGITHDELLSCGIKDERAYLNRVVCEQLTLLDYELKEVHGLRLVIKDAYRSEALYKLIIGKREMREGKEFVSHAFNTRGDFPHASGNSVDVAFVKIDTGEQILCSENIDDLDIRRKSWGIDYYKDSDNPEQLEIHRNRVFMREMMEKYGFEGIDHEYWHFNYKARV